MKPLGMTPFFQVVKPTRTEDAIWSAVEEAHSEGWTAKQFLAEVREAWGDVLREKAKAEDGAFDRALEEAE